MSAASARRCRLAKRARQECERCAAPASPPTTLCEAHRAARRAYCAEWRRRLKTRFVAVTEKPDERRSG